MKVKYIMDSVANVELSAKDVCELWTLIDAIAWDKSEKHRSDPTRKRWVFELSELARDLAGHYEGRLNSLKTMFEPEEK